MRPLASLFAIAALASLTPVAAQADGCTQTNPCDWVVVVGADGFLQSDWTWTAGDWLRLVVSNDDEVAHTVSIDGTSVRVTAPDIDEASSAPFQLAAGSYTLRDQPSGDTAAARAIVGDVAECEAGIASACATSTTSGRNGIPGFGLVAALVVIAAVAGAINLRRRMLA